MQTQIFEPGGSDPIPEAFESYFRWTRIVNHLAEAGEHESAWRVEGTQIKMVARIIEDTVPTSLEGLIAKMKFAGADTDPDKTDAEEWQYLDAVLIHVIYNDLLKMLEAQKLQTN